MRESKFKIKGDVFMSLFKKLSVKKSGRKTPRIRMVLVGPDGTRQAMEPFNLEAQRLRAKEAKFEPGFMGPAAGMYQQEGDMAELAKHGIRRLGQRLPSAGFERIGKNK